MTTPGGRRRAFCELLFTTPVLVALAILAGTAYAYSLLGPALDPRNLAWLSWQPGDPATAQVSWEFFRRSNWAWPPTLVADLGHPFGISIAFMDAIPLAAVLLKPFSALLPADFQYLGLVVAINLILQAYFAIRLLRKLFGDDPAVVLLGAMFVLIMTPLALRTMHHIALSSQWLIVAALSYYFDDPQHKGIARYLRPFFVLAAIAGAINPYITLMTLFVAVAAVFRLVLRRMLDWLRAGAVVLALAFIAACALGLFGFLSQQGGYSGGGYGYFSMNMLAVIDPWRFPSLLLPQQRTFPGQYEGYNYLGLGVIAMLLAGLALQFRSVRELKKPDVLPLAVLYLICSILAVSLTITFGPWELYRIRPGRFVTDLLATFRASGRLFWPAHYLLIVAGVVLIVRVVPARFRAAALAALLVLQLADTQSVRAAIRYNFEPNPPQARLDDPAWQALGKRHKHIVVVPPWQCEPKFDPVSAMKFSHLPMLAARQGMTINSYYAGRDDPAQWKYFCSVVERLRKDGLAPDTAYVFSPAAYDELWPAAIARTHTCQVADGLRLCVRKGSG